MFSAVSASRLAGERPLWVRHRRDQAGLAFLFQSITVALDHQGVTVVQQTIEDGCREDFVAEEGAPLRHQLIGW